MYPGYQQANNNSSNNHVYGGYRASPFNYDILDALVGGSGGPLQPAYGAQQQQQMGYPQQQPPYLQPLQLQQALRQQQAMQQGQQQPFPPRREYDNLPITMNQNSYNLNNGMVPGGGYPQPLQQQYGGGIAQQQQLQPPTGAACERLCGSVT